MAFLDCSTDFENASFSDSELVLRGIARERREV
jgi:hypothetical protein